MKYLFITAINFMLLAIIKETISNLLLDDLIEDLENIKNISIFPQHNIIPDANFVFAIFDGGLYVKPMKHSSMETRGSFARLSLYILTKKYNIPNCFAGLVGVHTDTPPHKGSSNALFSFSRLSGSKYPPLLFPDYDFFGFPDVWIPPYDLVVSDYARTDIPWEKKKNIAYWSGSPTGTSRIAAIKCSESFRSTVQFDVVAWRNGSKSTDQERSVLTAALEKYSTIITNPPEKRAYKPKVFDLRKMQEFKYNVYLQGNGWSSSLKRLVASGSALIMPTPNMWEDLVSRLLIKNNLVIPVQHNEWDDLCLHINNLINDTDSTKHIGSGNDAHAYALTQSLKNIAREELNMHNILEYIYTALSGLAKKQDVSKMSEATLMANGYYKYKCKDIMVDILTKGGLNWQSELWYNSKNCMPRADHSGDYLQYTYL